MFKKLLFIVISLVTLIGLFYGIENWRGKYAWETYRHEREAKGDSFEWSSIVPPPVPDAENFAATPLFAELFPKPPAHPRLEAISALSLPQNYYKSSGNWHVGRAENLADWQTCFSNNNLLAALSKYDPILNEITEASHRPKCRFPIRYEDNISALLPHLSYMRNLTRIYRLRALTELADGQTDAALADVQLCLRLANTLEDEPLLISFLVHIAMQDMTIQPIWEGLAAHRWTDAQLATLQAEFERVNQFNAFAKAMHGERIFAYTFERKLLETPSNFRTIEALNAFGSNSDSKLANLLYRAVPTGWWYQNMLSVDRFYTETYLPVIDFDNRIIQPSAIQKANAIVETSRTTPYNVLRKMLAAAMGNIARNAAQSQTALNQVTCACALERYRLAHGNYPEKLETLVPEFIAHIPHDVIDGQPLRYRRSAVDKFVLYSIGWKEKDDGGKINPDSWKNGDWVWQY